jgi:hypothetical protein
MRRAACGNAALLGWGRARALPSSSTVWPSCADLDPDLDICICFPLGMPLLVQGGPPGSRVWRGILIGHRATGPCTWDNSLRGRDTLNLWPEQLAVEAAAAPP